MAKKRRIETVASKVVGHYEVKDRKTGKLYIVRGLSTSVGGSPVPSRILKTEAYNDAVYAARKRLRHDEFDTCVMALVIHP